MHLPLLQAAPHPATGGGEPVPYHDLRNMPHWLGYRGPAEMPHSGAAPVSPPLRARAPSDGAASVPRDPADSSKVSAWFD